MAKTSSSVSMQCRLILLALGSIWTDPAYPPGDWENGNSEGEEFTAKEKVGDSGVRGGEVVAVDTEEGDD